MLFAKKIFHKIWSKFVKSTGSCDEHHFLKFWSKSVEPIQYSNETMFSQIFGQNLWKSNGSWDEQFPLGVQRLPICMILSHPRTHPPHIHTIKKLLSIIIYHKVKMCLARYSPVPQPPANPPTGHQMGQQGLAQNEQKRQFQAKFGRFGAKNPNFYWKNQKFCYPLNRKPT